MLLFNAPTTCYSEDETHIYPLERVGPSQNFGQAQKRHISVSEKLSFATKLQVAPIAPCYLNEPIIDTSANDRCILLLTSMNNYKSGSILSSVL